MKISVILSTYNRANTYLPQAIQSVISQTFGNWELIIVDDCSTDNTEEVVRSFKDKRIKYHRLDINSGSDTKPKNDGTKLSDGGYIMYLDDDVQLRPTAFRKLSKLLSTNPSIDVVYGDMWIRPVEKPGIAMDFDRQFLMVRNYIDTSAAMMRRKAIFDVGGWDESLKKFVDWNLWVRMVKCGKKFLRLPEYTFDYYIHEDTKSNKVKTDSYFDPKYGMTMFVPTFDPAGCYIELPYLKKLTDPKVAIFTIHYDRMEYSFSTYDDIKATTKYPFDWYCWDNGDGLLMEWLESHTVFCGTLRKNLGITAASNKLLDAIVEQDKHDLILKIDNDVEFQTFGWLEDIVDLWKRNHMIYVSPYVEGLYHNPGGAIRKGYGMIGDDLVEVTRHIGGIFTAVWSKFYEKFRWTDQMKHGNQDIEASHAVCLEGYMPCYYPKHRICHRDGTLGQENKYTSYFERRKAEKNEC